MPTLIQADPRESLKHNMVFLREYARRVSWKRMRASHLLEM